MTQTKAQLIDGKAASIEFNTGSAAAPTVSFTGDTNTGIYSPGADQLALSTNGTGRLFIDSAGLVGIGTSSPSTLLHIASSTKPVFRIDNTNTALTNGADIGSVDWYINDASSGGTGVGGEIALVGDGTMAGGGVATRMEFRTYNATSLNTGLTINKDGRVGIGTTGPGDKLTIQDGSIQLYDSTTTASSNQIKFQRFGARYAYITGEIGTDASGNPTQIAFGTNAAGASPQERARIDSSGRLLVGTSTSQGSYNIQCYGTGVWGQGAYVNGSDANIKQNIQDLEPALDVIKAMRPVTFQYKEEYSSDQTIQPGFIAQELQTAMAGKAYVDGVVQQGTTHLNVAYSSIIAVLVKAVQELEAKVAALESA